MSVHLRLILVQKSLALGNVRLVVDILFRLDVWRWAYMRQILALCFARSGERYCAAAGAAVFIYRRFEF